MSLSLPQEQFVAIMRRGAEDLALALMRAAEVVAVFEDRGYSDAGNISDEDLAPFDLTRAQVAAYIEALRQLGNWRDNLPVTQGDHGAAVNQVRTL